MEAEDFTRKAPYAPVSALREFLERIPDIAVPGRVDRRFLQRLNIASNNEWALLSALKFLGIIDQQGVPTSAYRRLQTTDRFEDTMHHLVETAYEPLLRVGGANMAMDDLRNYFRVSSSPSQAKNAARFFKEVSSLAKVGKAAPSERAVPARPSDELLAAGDVGPTGGTDTSPLLLEAKARLLEKLPAVREDWSAVEYEAICARFLEMLRNLGGE